MIGYKGTGKSSLLKSLLEELKESGEEKNDTNASIAVMNDAACIFDTRGFKNLSITDIRGEEWEYFFPEFAEYAKMCRYANCLHINEPECAVKLAVRDRLIPRSRYESYLALVSGEDEVASGHVGQKNVRDLRANKRTDINMRSSRGNIRIGSGNMRYQDNMRPGRNISSRRPDRHIHGPDESSGFRCEHCGEYVPLGGGGTRHRNHCPKCLWSKHLDFQPGDRASCCDGLMEPIAVWVRKGGEWAIIHRCEECGALSSNRIAADDDEIALLSLAANPLMNPPFPLKQFGEFGLKIPKWPVGSDENND